MKFNEIGEKNPNGEIEVCLRDVRRRLATTSLSNTKKKLKRSYLELGDIDR